jgi:hypothetical protein
LKIVPCIIPFRLVKLDLLKGLYLVKILPVRSLKGKFSYMIQKNMEVFFQTTFLGFLLIPSPHFSFLTSFFVQRNLAFRPPECLWLPAIEIIEKIYNEYSNDPDKNCPKNLAFKYGMGVYTLLKRIVLFLSSVFNKIVNQCDLF